MIAKTTVEIKRSAAAIEGVDFAELISIWWWSKSHDANEWTDADIWEFRKIYPEYADEDDETIREKIQMEHNDYIFVTEVLEEDDYEEGSY